MDLHTLEKMCDYLECDVCDILKMVEAEGETEEMDGSVL